MNGLTEKLISTVLSNPNVYITAAVVLLLTFIFNRCLKNHGIHQHADTTHAPSTAGTSTLALAQLNDLLQDEVLNILQTYFELKIVQIEGGTLFFFLHNRLHELFHYFTRQPCCSTATPCAAIRMKGTLTKDQFFLLFENDPLVQPTHEKKDRGRIAMHCICPLTPNRSTKILALDFTLINCLIKTSHQTPPAGNPQWIKEIMEVRNHLSHKGDASTVTDLQIKEWWNRLKKAAVNIAGTMGETYQEGVKRRIDRRKKPQFEMEEMIKALKTRDDDLEKKMIDALRNLGVRVGEVPFQITTTEFLKEEPQISLVTPVLSSSNDPNKCTVVWTFSNPGDWDVKKMQQKLEQMNRLGDFNIQFVYHGSLVIHTQADAAILYDDKSLKDSIEEFLCLLIMSLQIQAPGSGRIAVTISIWSPRRRDGSKKDEYYGTVSGSVKEDKQTSSVLSLEEEECHREAVTRSIKEETQIRADFPAEEEECHRETVTRSINEETQIRADLPAEEGEIYTETVTESVKNETQTSLVVSTKEDECRRKTVTELFEEDDQTSYTLTEEESDFQKETVQEVMKEETLATSALQAEDTTHAQAPVNKSQLPRELKKIKQIDISGYFINCTAVDDTFVICDNSNNRLVVIDSDGSNVRDIPLPGKLWKLTTIDNTTVAVIIGNRDIDIINIYSGDRIRRISVDDYVRGLTYSEPHIYLGVAGKGIQVIDLHGYTIKIIPTERDVYCMTTNKQSIYYRDNDTISCVTQSGERMWTVDDPMVKGIQGLTTDDTNIYVTGYFSHTVFVISPDGKQVRRLLSESNGLKLPFGICYNKKLKTLMVCNRYGPAYLFNIVK